MAEDFLGLTEYNGAHIEEAQQVLKETRRQDHMYTHHKNIENKIVNVLKSFREKKQTGYRHRISY